MAQYAVKDNKSLETIDLNDILSQIETLQTNLNSLKESVNSLITKTTTGTVNNSNYLGGTRLENIYNESQNGGKWYHITMTNTSSDATGFYRIANIKMPSGYGPYTAAKIVGYLYDHNGNWEQSQTYKIPFQCVVNITHDAGYLWTNTTYGDTNHIRLVKLGTRDYELQARCNQQHCDFDIYYTIYSSNGVTNYDSLVPASSGGTVISNSSLTCWI